MPPGPRLAIDYGTSHTVSMVAWPDGRVRPLLFDGSPLLPSAVFAEVPHGPDAVPTLVAGRDAVHAARVDPARFEATPKRRIDDGSVLLGMTEYPVTALIAATLTRVREEALRVLGRLPGEVILSHPASWGVSRRLTLLEAAAQAGLGEPDLVAEPVAAARYFAGLIGERFAAGHGVLVYDFGGGTFDASLVSRAATGFEVRAVDGIDDLGGLDLDELVVEYAREQLSACDAEAWRRLTDPQTPEDRRHRRGLWEDAKMTKERLSRSEVAQFHLPLINADVTLTRTAFEDRARAAIERTVRTTAAVLRWSGLPRQQLAGVFLVGGSSRIPLVSHLLEREFGVPPTMLEQPELVVAEGALRPGGVPSAPPPAPAVVAPAVPFQAAPGASEMSGLATQAPSPIEDDDDEPAYQLAPAHEGLRRTWWVPFLSALFVVAVVAAASAIGPVIFQGRSDHRRTGASPSSTPYQRGPRPDWLPASWVVAVNARADQLWQTSDEAEGGHCEAVGDVLKVTRPDNRNLTGCTIMPPLDRPFTDVAVEVQVTVNRGCAGLWARTGNRGYSLAICRTGIQLLRLGQTAADSVRIGQWGIRSRPRGSTVGLLVVGNQLSVYLDGQRLGLPVQDSEILRGRVTAGGHVDLADPTIDVILQEFRVYAPVTSGQQPSPGQPTPGPQTPGQQTPGQQTQPGSAGPGGNSPAVPHLPSKPAAGSAH